MNQEQLLLIRHILIGAIGLGVIIVFISFVMSLFGKFTAKNFVKRLLYIIGFALIVLSLIFILLSPRLGLDSYLVDTPLPSPPQISN